MTALHRQLETIRNQGYAFSDEKHIRGLRAVATPVPKADGEVEGSVSVAGAARRMQGEWFEAELPERLLGVVNEIELDLLYS